MRSQLHAWPLPETASMQAAARDMLCLHCLAAAYTRLCTSSDGHRVGQDRVQELVARVQHLKGMAARNAGDAVISKQVLPLPGSVTDCA